MFRSSKLFFAVLIVLIFATSAFAFAAGINGMPANTYAGEGATIIGDFDLLDLDYTLTGGSPSTISNVTLKLDPAAAQVSVDFDGVAPFTACTSTDGGVTWNCPTTADVASATQLVIIASDR